MKNTHPGIDPSKLHHGSIYYLQLKNDGQNICIWNETLQKFWNIKYMVHHALWHIKQVRGPIIYDDIPWLMERTNEQRPSQQNRTRGVRGNRTPRASDLAGSAGQVVPDERREHQ